ncbi:MAG TPA: orotidine-5'-phosphate decarboxylase [Candidatus Binatia bacterium]|jgi:orotidine-5'-phosphate decarboxylase
MHWRFGAGRASEAKRRLIFALDVDSVGEANALIETLLPEVGMFKVGKQLFLHAGPPMVRQIKERGGEVFLDLKFHDIPRTVAKAGVEAARLGVKMFDLHASGSGEMMRTTVREVSRACRRDALRRPKILAVTVLTSLSREDLKQVGVMAGVESQVTRLARLAKDSGMDGVVASPQEIATIRKACGRTFAIVTPGVRQARAGWDDQKRVMTPEAAIAAGADYLVVGKPIRDAKSPADAARAIVAEMERGLAALVGRGAGRSGAA